jgi:hypothetical protein
VAGRGVFQNVIEPFLVNGHQIGLQRSRIAAATLLEGSADFKT